MNGKIPLIYRSNRSYTVPRSGLGTVYERLGAVYERYFTVHIPFIYKNIVHIPFQPFIYRSNRSYTVLSKRTVFLETNGTVK